MLEGLSADWVPDGARRRASYANLPPGRYRFRVSATTDGIWTEAAVWEFAVAPPFYLRTWFVGASGLGLALMIGTAWWLRVRTIHHQFSLVFAERTRVSREIHDTLLQSLGAIGMELETIAREVDSSQDAAIRSLRRLRRQVAHSVREARQSIWELRSDRIETHGLPEALRHWISDGSSGRIVHADVVEGGRARRYPAEIEEQLLRIAQEAITNAARHASAQHIHVSVEHRRDAVVLRVSDDGRGFVPEDCRAAGGEHWGLVTIKERAARVGGYLTIASSPGNGTVVEATAPVSSVE
jgi:signal transduction histidine kinase